MQAIGQYLLSVSSAAIISAIVLRLLDGKGGESTMGRLLVGIFMTLTVISPFTQFRLADFGSLLPDVTADAKEAVTAGEVSAKNALTESITARLEAYILDKAAQMDVTLTVELELSEDAIPTPKAVRLHGNASPYAKIKLQNILYNDLGIEKENQQWT